MPKRILLLIMVFAFVSCAGSDKKKTESEKKEKLEERLNIPKDLAQQFEVKGIESGQPATEKPDPATENAALANVKTSVMDESQTDSSKDKSREKDKSEKGKKHKPGKEKLSARKKDLKKRNALNRDAIQIGEKIVMDITYFGVSAGKFTLKVMPYKMLNSKKVFHFRADAVTSPVFSLFYRANDYVESFVDYSGFFPYKIVVNCDESLQQKDTVEVFDHKKKTSHFWLRRDHKKKGLLVRDEKHDLIPYSQDSISALYFLRTFDLKVGDVIKYPIMANGKQWEVDVKVLRREEITTKLGRLKTLVVKPETKFQGILKKKGDVFFWLTDDDRKFFVKLQAKIKIGSLVGYVESIDPGGK